MKTWATKLWSEPSGAARSLRPFVETFVPAVNLILPVFYTDYKNQSIQITQWTHISLDKVNFEGLDRKQRITTFIAEIRAPIDGMKFSGTVLIKKSGV